MIKAKTCDIGQQAEQLACKFLQQKGFKLCERNYRCKVGEIDLIMKDKEYLVFIEVRKRKYEEYGSGSESVVWQKRQRIVRTAKHYLQAKDLYYRALCRFDIVSMNQQSKLTWIANAFDAT